MTKELATLAGGCFWCTEALFTRLRGVLTIIPGYAGGTVENPTYEQVSSGTTGHAESVQIEFDSDEIPFEKLLDVFWHTHNPTTPNRQGDDIGTQYRSVIFYRSEKQKEVAQKSKMDLEMEKLYPDPIITEIIPFTNFYVAEDYHQKFYEKNRDHSYCTFAIDPKIQKLLQMYRKDIKEEYLEK